MTASAGLCVGGVLVLTACIPPGIACPAIMYTSSVVVHVDGEIAFLDACAGSDCDAASTLVVSKNGSGSWGIQFPAGPPDELTLLAYGAGGVLLAEEDFDLVWEPVGDPGPCPGPVSTPALEFSIQ